MKNIRGSAWNERVEDDDEEEEEAEEDEKDEEGVRRASLCSIPLKREKNLCTRNCDSGGKRGIGGGIGQIPKRGRQDWPAKQEAKEEKAKRGKKVGSLKN